MKLLIKYIHLILSIGVAAYLCWMVYAGNAGYSIGNASDIIKSIVPIALIIWLKVVIRKPSLGLQKWIIIALCIALIIVAQVLYTDTTTFFGSDMSKIFATLTLFLALFGVFGGKVVQAKGQYSKKAEIIEV